MEFFLVSRSRLLTFFSTFFIVLVVFAVSFLLFSHYSQFKMIWIYLAVFVFLVACAPLVFRYWHPGQIWFADDHFIIRNRFKQMRQYKLNAADSTILVVNERGSELLDSHTIFTIEYFLTPSYRKVFAFVVPQKEYKNIISVIRLWKEKGFKVEAVDQNGKPVQV